MPDRLSFELLGTLTWPMIETGPVPVKAFLCITKEAGSSITESYYYFIPNSTRTRSIVLSGSTLTELPGKVWLENPGGFTFVAVSEAPDTILLYDSSRSYYWDIPLPNGTSKLRGYNSGWLPFKTVEAVAIGTANTYMIAGPGVRPQELSLNGARPSTIESAFKFAVDEVKCRKFIEAVDRWNADPVLDESCLGIVSGLMEASGIPQPDMSQIQTPADYVRSIARLSSSP